MCIPGFFWVFMMEADYSFMLKSKGDGDMMTDYASGSRSALHDMAYLRWSIK